LCYAHPTILPAEIFRWSCFSMFDNMPRASSTQHALRRGARGAPAFIMLACVVAVASTWLGLRQAFLGTAPAAQGRSYAHKASVVTRTATAEDTEEAHVPERPSPPNSTEVMCKQAAEAAMNAYRDGYARQTIRLRTDPVMQEVNQMGDNPYKLLEASLPLARSFASKLWGGEYLKRLKTQRVDEETSTLIYREADNPLQDAAVLYFPGRELITSNKMRNFFKSMGDRLVVLANTEQGFAPWKVENKGMDFYLVGDSESAAEVCDTFGQQSYYYYICPLNNWQTTYFRAYPHPWEIYVENLEYKRVKIGESEEKPNYDKVLKMMEEYETKNGIKIAQKVGKFLKDTAGEMM